MILIILIGFFSLIGLVILHEFGHFILAKRFGVKVEEFGIGFPPRLLGKKIGETIYSFNLLPLGGFVKIYGEEGGIEDCRSFTEKPVWQRCLIILGGVVAFWLTAIIILTIVVGSWGMPISITDETELNNNNLVNPQVQISGVLANTPAQKIDLKTGDIIVGFQKVKDFQQFIKDHQNKEINFKIKRGDEILEKKVEIGEMLGVKLFRTATKTYPWYLTPWGGVEATVYYTTQIFYGWVMMGGWALGLSELPEGITKEDIEVKGPVGIFMMLGKFFKMGPEIFLRLVALIAIALAMVNILPIPALDGGKMVFLAIEAIRRKPINYKIEQKINTIFFVLLIALMIFITVRFDIPDILNFK